MTNTPNRAAETPKRRGRPRGAGLPPEQRKSAMIRVRVTAAQQAKFERLGGEQWLRDRIDRARS
jgi:hypothetical protein